MRHKPVTSRRELQTSLIPAACQTELSTGQLVAWVIPVFCIAPSHAHTTTHQQAKMRGRVQSAIVALLATAVDGYATTMPAHGLRGACRRETPDAISAPHSPQSTPRRRP